MALLQCGSILTVPFIPNIHSGNIIFLIIPPFTVGVNLICKIYAHYRLFMPIWDISLQKRTRQSVDVSAVIVLSDDLSF